MDSIGSTEFITIGTYANIPAKVDTGADASAIWASGIRVGKDGVLRFTLFDKESPFYTGRVFKRTDFGVARVKSSNGTIQLRYRTHLVINVGGRRIKALFYLADRSTQKFPVLIGRRTIVRKFVVDVSKRAIALQRPVKAGLNAKLQANPYKFHKRYLKETTK